MPSIKKNIFYSTLLTVSGYLFPLITYPYVNRVLGVDKIGICNYVDSYIQYGILFSMLGIGTVAIREIAQHKNNREQLSKTFSSLLALNLATSFIAIIVILAMAFFVPKFYEYQRLLIIGASKILFNALLVEWLYKGLEEFKYITIRSLLIKMLYVIAIFVFVRSADSYVVYFSINAIMVIVNSIVNILYSRRYLSFSLRNLDFSPFLKPVLILGFYTILTSMYTSFNVMYLGFVNGTTEVGYYSTAVKLFTIVISFFTAITGVMMPRLSAILGNGNTDEFINLSNKSVDLLLACVMPLIIYVYSYADDIIRLIAGLGYEGAIIPLKIIAPLLLIIGYEQVIVIQMLMPLKKDNAILVNSIIGASVGLLLNTLLVKNLGSIGSAIVWLASELSVAFSAQFFIHKYVSFSFPWKKLFVRLLYGIPILIGCLFLRMINMNYILSLVLGFTVIGLYYCVIEGVILKNEYVQLGVRKTINAITTRKTNPGTDNTHQF